MDASKFTIIPNEVIADHRLTLIETRVLMALFSFRGKNTNLVWPSREAISFRCGYKVGTVSNATKSLIEKGWLKKSKQVFNGPNTFEIVVPEVHRSGEVHRISEVHRSGEHEVHRSGEHIPHRSGETEHTKNKPKNRPIEYPDWLNMDLWREFIATRRTGKTKFTRHAEKLALTKLESLCPEGANHEAVINQTIEHGWKSFFPLKGDAVSKLQEWANG